MGASSRGSWSRVVENLAPCSTNQLESPVGRSGEAAREPIDRLHIEVPFAAYGLHPRVIRVERGIQLCLPTYLRNELGYRTRAMVSMPVLNRHTPVNRDFDTATS
jgi:hypothetical protein